MIRRVSGWDKGLGSFHIIFNIIMQKLAIFNPVYNKLKKSPELLRETVSYTTLVHSVTSKPGTAQIS